MIMGDFNDYPTNNSIAKVLGAVAPKSGVQAKKLYNLMDGRKEGTYRYRGEWGVLDQLIVSGFCYKGMIVCALHMIRHRFKISVPAGRG